ncbi:hypothetical protein ROHU_000868 [Labeo rohita]|uniref:Uncharacterized protein n=1 Tax=Labeo rohita TaxID=84645 RepID=A0A498P3T9_LABRO|nr:hypothetical protein ROHU_000868 [Labeo rohita]
MSAASDSEYESEGTMILRTAMKDRDIKEEPAQLSRRSSHSITCGETDYSTKTLRTESDSHIQQYDVNIRPTVTVKWIN